MSTSTAIIIDLSTTTPTLPTTTRGTSTKTTKLKTTSSNMPSTSISNLKTLKIEFMIVGVVVWFFFIGFSAGFYVLSKNRRPQEDKFTEMIEIRQEDKITETDFPITSLEGPFDTADPKTCPKCHKKFSTPLGCINHQRCCKF